MTNDSTNQCWHFACTIWNTERNAKDVQRYFERIAKKYIFQLEKCPSTKRLHYQCYINLKKKVYKNKLCKMFNTNGFPGTDCRPASDEGKDALKDYCMKPDSRVAGPWADKALYFGQDLITELRPWQQDIVNMLDVTPDPRQIHWFYDAAGGRGKSSIAKYLYFHHKVLTLSIGKASDLLNLVFKIQGRRMYIFDISRTVPQGTMNEIYMALESVKNGYFVNTKYDTGVCCMNIPHVIVFSNHLPKLSALSNDRWVIHDLSQISQDNYIMG